MGRKNPERVGIQKGPTGIDGLDQVTAGGLPRGRPTLICGGPGCGKSLLGLSFLIRGVTQFNEPGVLMTFEESESDIKKNVASLGFDVDDLIRRKKLAVDYVRVERQEIDENGEYDLEGLFIRLDHAIKAVGAKRVMLDTIESLFAGLKNEAILRSEIRRLFAWLKERGMTTIITGERGHASLTRQGLEEYVSDCVILLDHQLHNQVSTRRLRVVKYRGSAHGTNEYPFLIDEDGISVLPITSLGLSHTADNRRVSSGIPRLDKMLGGDGVYHGSSVLITGTAGTGKSTIAAHFADATCRAGERCLYFAFEESPSQIMRNMKSIKLDLSPHVRSGRLHFFAARPSLYGLEMHLAMIHKRIEEFKPDAVVIDPISNFSTTADERDVHAMLVRLIDYLKTQNVTCLMTNLTAAANAKESTDMGISSIMDTWILLRDIELGGERNRGIYVLKSRGTAHSNQIREFLITSQGVDILDVYVGPEGVLTGSARVAREARERAEQMQREQDSNRKKFDLQRRKEAMEIQIASLRADFQADEKRVMRELGIENLREETIKNDRDEMGRSRRAEALSENGSSARRKNR